MTLRLFLAVDVPGPQRDAAAALCRDVEGARWTRPDQFHLTLSFWAHVPEDQLSPLRAALAQVQVPAFAAAIAGVGVFPPGRKPPRVLWLGLEPAAPLVSLKAAIDAALSPLALSEEQRAFHPHLTLARFRERPARNLQDWLRTHGGFRGEPWTVDGFHLYRSHLGREGAVHERLETFDLRAG